MEQKKKILLIATGGTIASKETENGLAPSVSSHDLCQSVPETASFCELDAIQLFNIDSTNIQPEHWLQIARTIEAHFDAYDGFVITHGTDTMAYTAAAMSYLIQNPGKPIILTGSQKPLLDPITDAKKNLPRALFFGAIFIIAIYAAYFVGIFGVSAALEGFFLHHMRWYERVMAAAGGLMLIYPGLVTDTLGLGLVAVVLIIQIASRKKANA